MGKGVCMFTFIRRCKHGMPRFDNSLPVRIPNKLQLHMSFKTIIGLNFKIVV